MLETSTDQGITYKDCYYTTKLEAKWAVFFDNLNIKYDYEPRRKNVLSGKVYIPKFYLHKYDIFADIHPQKKETAELEKEYKFATQNNLLIIFGEPAIDGYVVKYIGDSFSDDVPSPYMDNAVFAMGRRTDCLYLVENEEEEIEYTEICNSFCSDPRCTVRQPQKHHKLENVYLIASQAEFYN